MNIMWNLQVSGTILLFCCTYFLHATTNNNEWKANTKKYGEACVDQDECVDFRMICSPTETVCRCDQFHDWTELDDYRSECLLNVDRLRYFVSNNEEKRNFEDELSKESHNLFVYLGLAGIVAISFGILLAICCVVIVFV